MASAGIEFLFLFLLIFFLPVNFGWPLQELKGILRERGAKLGGNKQELVERVVSELYQELGGFSGAARSIEDVRNNKVFVPAWIDHRVHLCCSDD